MVGFLYFFNNDFFYLVSYVKFSKSWDIDYFCFSFFLCGYFWYYFGFFLLCCGIFYYCVLCLEEIVYLDVYLGGFIRFFISIYINLDFKLSVVGDRFSCFCINIVEWSVDLLKCLLRCFIVYECFISVKWKYFLFIKSYGFSGDRG